MLYIICSVFIAFTIAIGSASALYSLNKEPSTQHAVTLIYEILFALAFAYIIRY